MIFPFIEGKDSFKYCITHVKCNCPPKPNNCLEHCTATIAANTQKPSFCFFWAIQRRTCLCASDHCPAAESCCTWAAGHELMGWEQSLWLHDGKSSGSLNSGAALSSSSIHPGSFVTSWASCWSALGGCSVGLPLFQGSSIWREWLSPSALVFL